MKILKPSLLRFLCGSSEVKGPPNVHLLCIFFIKNGAILDHSAIGSSNRRCVLDSFWFTLCLFSKPHHWIFFFFPFFWLEMMNNMEDEYIRRHHRHVLDHNQCSSSLVKRIRAPVNLVSLIHYVLDLFIFSQIYMWSSCYKGFLGLFI